MISKRRLSVAAAICMTLTLVAGVVILVDALLRPAQIQVTAYFANTNGIFVGDEVRILGVPVGEIDSIEPLPEQARVKFSVSRKYEIPADVKAVILAPSLVTARAIQLTPAYTSGPVLENGAQLPIARTAVPVEWDDLREQLEKLTTTLQPTEPGGVSTLGAFISTAANNLRGQGPDIRKTVIELSQVFSALGDHSDDIFSTIKNLSILVSALHDSSDVMSQLNTNLAAVTALLADDPNEIGSAVEELSKAADGVASFVSDNRESVGVASDKLASISTALTAKTDDIKQILHVVPNLLANFNNIYQPAQGALTGALALNNFSNPISFICGAIEAASRMNAEQSAKLCVQYLAPIIKNRQINFPPLGLNPLVGAVARPNEVTYSEPRLRPDFVPPAPPPPAAAPLPAESADPAAAQPLPAANSIPTDPSAGLAGLMVPPGGGR